MKNKQLEFDIFPESETEISDTKGIGFKKYINRLIKENYEIPALL